MDQAPNVASDSKDVIPNSTDVPHQKAADVPERPNERCDGRGVDAGT